MHLQGECKGRSLARMLRTLPLPVLLLTLVTGLGAQTPTPRPVMVTDLFRLREVADPQLSPDGAWVAYTVTGADSAEDKQPGAAWMTSWDGARPHAGPNQFEGGGKRATREPGRTLAGVPVEPRGRAHAALAARSFGG